MCRFGTQRYKAGDYDVALKYWSKAAELGDLNAHHRLGQMYYQGECVEKDEEKGVFHSEKAAIGGNPDARMILGCYEGMNGRVERGVKHFIIAANLGHEVSMKALWREFRVGNITKEDLDATLRTHKAAIDAMKSSERDLAEGYLQYEQMK